MQITATRTQEQDQASILGFAFLQLNGQALHTQVLPPHSPHPATEAHSAKDLSARDLSPVAKSVERDMPEVAARFNGPKERPMVASFGVETLLQAGAGNSDFNAATIGKVTFRRVPPFEANRAEIVTADERLQMHLESLCENLRSRY